MKLNHIALAVSAALAALATGCSQFPGRADAGLPDKPIYRVVALDRNYDALFALGRYELANRNVDAAIDAFVKAAALRPTSVQALNALAVAYASAGRHDASVATFTDALRLDPGAAHVHSNLGFEHLRVGRMIDAERSLREAARLDPSSTTTRENLALLEATRSSAVVAAAAQPATIATQPADPPAVSRAAVAASPALDRASIAAASIEPVVATPVVAAPIVASPVVASPVIAAPVVAAPVVAVPVVPAPVAAAPIAAAPIVAAPIVAAPIVAAPIVAAPIVAAPVMPPAESATVLTTSSGVPVVTSAGNPVVTAAIAPRAPAVDPETAPMPISVAALSTVITSPPPAARPLPRSASMASDRVVVKSIANRPEVEAASLSRPTGQSDGVRGTTRASGPALVEVSPSVYELRDRAVHGSTRATGSISTPQVAAAPAARVLIAPDSWTADRSDPAGAAAVRIDGLEVSNGVGTPGLAGRAARGLRGVGIAAERVSDYLDFKQRRTMILYRPGHFEQAKALRKLLPGNVMLIANRKLLRSQINLRLVIGHDLNGKRILAWADAQELAMGADAPPLGQADRPDPADAADPSAAATTASPSVITAATVTTAAATASPIIVTTAAVTTAAPATATAGRLASIDGWRWY